jgi:hypothetical protein
VIDEAGMADTVSLDAAVTFIVGRGGSVRLVGDDQQLAAIGAGGVLRDIAHTHGAARLTELHRFTDPAEGFASLALRDGRPEALGFYLDQRRVHVGDLTALTAEVFTAWQTDRSNGLDAIMLAPTRELVSQLNQRARTHRLTTQLQGNQPEASRLAMLADGNPASAGEPVITRTNNRTLRLTATDWVKNGDRWTVLKVSRSGDLTVRHHRNGRTVRLPANYVTESVELGYATTVHTAQGVTADTMHGLADGTECRQQLYTMLTRGRIANHLYLQVVGDGDPHSLIRPETIHPSTATDLLERILARDDTARSATTLERDQHDPAVRLADAAGRYVDALQVAAEDLAGREVVEAMYMAAEQMVPGLTDEPAWPTLRAHLLLLAAHGTDPVAQLAAVAGSRGEVLGGPQAVRNAAARVCIAVLLPVPAAAIARSAPAASSATSPTPTEQPGSPSCTGSPTPPKASHPSPSATADPKRSASTSTSVASTSATSPRRRSSGLTCIAARHTCTSAMTLLGGTLPHRVTHAGGSVSTLALIWSANKVQTFDGRWLSIDGRILWSPGTTPSRHPWRSPSAPVTTSQPDPPIRLTRCRAARRIRTGWSRISRSQP